MNFLQVGRISLLRVAENIMTCLWCGVDLKISCTSRRMSGEGEAMGGTRREEGEAEAKGKGVKREKMVSECS